MSGRRRSKISPSLFPFLAVLICTLGTLILMLALVAQDAADQAVAKAQQKAREKAERQAELARANTPPEGHPGLTTAVADELIAEQEDRVARLVSYRKTQTEDVELRRDKVAQVESHIDRLTEQLRRLNAEVERTHQSDFQSTVDEQALVILRREINEENEKLKELKEKKGSGKPRVVIVPYKGDNGTDRRPIYLECTAQGLTIWPEKVPITVNQLRNSTLGANPIEAALRVIRAHSLKVYGDPSPPYPLLVVRPDGIETYGAARSALSEFDDQFGYELVPFDVELALPDGDANLKEKTEQVVAKAVSNQQSPSRFAAGNGAGNGGRGNTSRPRNPRPLSAAEFERQGRSRGWGSAAGGGWSPGGNDAASIARSYANERQLQQSRSQLADGRFGGGNNDFGNPSNQLGSSNLATSGPNGGGATNNGIDSTTRQWDQDFQAAANELKQQNSQPTQAQGSFSPDNFASGSDSGNHPFTHPSAASPGNLSGEAKNPFELPSDSSSISSADPSLASATSAGQGQNAREGELGDQTSDTHSTNGQTGEANSQRSANASASTPGGGPGGQAAANGGSPSGQQQATSQNPQQQSGQSASQQRQTSPPSAAPPSSNLVQPGSGGQWALPSRIAGVHGNSIVRIITAEAHADRYVLWPSRGGGTEVFGVFNHDSRRAMLQLATALRDRIDQWGAALPGGRWEPTLEVIVQPGGESRFRELQRLMQNSGITVTPKANP